MRNDCRTCVLLRRSSYSVEFRRRRGRVAPQFPNPSSGGRRLAHAAGRFYCYLWFSCQAPDGMWCKYVVGVLIM